MARTVERFILIGSLALLALVSLLAGSLWSGSSPALTGIVTSEAEGPMEGVLVSAKRVGGTITVTVVSDKSGRYSFPAERLAPGQYQITIRAIGYDGATPRMMATVGDRVSDTNLKLSKTSDLAAQLTDIEWLMTIPGSDHDKEYLFETCSHCHTLEPILKSTYNAEEWKTTLIRMRNWDQISSINHPVHLKMQAGAAPGDEAFGKFLSSINLSARATHDFELKTLPRPSGSDTRVIVTEYDLPRAGAEPHDAVPSKDGMVWYGDFMDGIVGRLNPKTGETQEWKDPVEIVGVPGSFQDLELDHEGNPVLGRHNMNGIAKFDKKSEQFTNWSVPPEYGPAVTNTSFLDFTRDGKIWFKDNTDRKLFRIEPATGQMTAFNQFPKDLDKDGAKGNHNIYSIRVDSKGNVYEADIAGSAIFVVDAETGRVATYPTLTPNSGPRRMHMDSNDRLWIGEYYGKKIAMLDPKTEKLQEWSVPVPWYGPYDAVRDKNGNVWTGTMTSELILRFNPATGEFRKYLLPRLGVNVRRVDVDNSGASPIFWVGENHQAKIAKVEPLD